MREYIIVYQRGKPMFVRSAAADANCDPKATSTKTFKIDWKALQADYTLHLLTAGK